jgi:hypothetical protein
MKTHQKKEIATSLTTFGFLVIGLTGILMFFHIFDKYTKNLHEILGLIFILIVIFHLIFNWKSFKKYFSNKIFYASAVIITAISLGFILNTEEGTHPKKILFNLMLNSPIEKTFALISDDFESSKLKLINLGFTIKDGSSLRELAKLNKTTPYNIIGILSE